MKLFLKWLINALALLLVAYLLPGFEVGSFYIALIVALILGLLNALVRPILVILTLPVTILTLGLSTFVINALLIWLTSTFIQDFSVDGFLTALWAALILWAIAWATNSLLRKE